MVHTTTLAFLLMAPAGLPGAQEANRPGPDEGAIRKLVAEYTAAFNRGDAAGIAASWSEEGEFLTPAGEKLQGRAAIQAAFEEFFKENKKAKVDVTIKAIRVEESGAAVEEGTATLAIPDQPASVTNYVARYTKEAGQWKLQTIRETFAPPTHYEQLKQLEWLIGEWGDAGEGTSVRTSCRWTKNRNFITRSFQISVEGSVELEGTQVIGWDPDKKVIRSWIFDSDGGFGAGLWTLRGRSWSVQSLQVLADGRRASSVNVITPIDANSFTWESTGRAVSGEILPNVGPLTIVRRQESN